MIGYVESRIARQEHEERVRSLTRVDDYDVWLTRRAGNWLSQPVGGLLLSLGKSLSALAGKLKPSRAIVPDSSPAEKRQSRVSGFTGIR
jgi:hypothetical protein